MTQTGRPAPTGVGVSLLILLSVTSALSPFAMVVMAPALDALGVQFGVGAARTQFIVSAYLLGLAFAQPAAGILCDRIGRRPVMLWGFAIFVVTSIACALVDSLELLIGLRFLQAAGVSVGTVTSRATVRDLNDASGSARALSYISAAMGLAPIVGPAVGGSISAAYGPQAVFFASASLGVVVWVWGLARYPETTDPASRPKPSLGEWLRSYAELLRSRVFIGYSMMYGLAQAVFFAFMTVGAAVFSRDLGLGPGAFGATWGALAFAYVAGATLTGKLAARVPAIRLLGAGLATILVGTFTLLALVLTVGVNFWVLTIPLIVLSLANGIVTPLSLAGAVSYRPLIAGTSSGLSSAIGLSLSGLFTIVTGLVYTGSFVPVAILMAGVAALTAATGWLTRADD